MSGSSALSGANPTIYGSPVSVESVGGTNTWLLLAGAGALLLMAYMFSRRK